MEIILVRHAKAEKRRMEIEDDRRYVTKKGEEKFQKLLPELREKLHLPSERKVILWSSPALRALETAHILARNFQINISSVHDFIYEGDFEQLTQAIQTIDEETTLFIVGHQPYLNEWIYDLTGKEEKIKKGNIISLKITSRNPLEAKAQWMIIPQEE